VIRKYPAGVLFLLTLVMAPVAWSSAEDPSAESASLLCKILDGNDALTQASEYSAEHRSVFISIDGTPEDASKFCPVIDGIVADNEMTFGEGWTVQITSPGNGDKVAAVCPL